MMQVPAEGGDSCVLPVMLDCGFDRDGVTALHGAAMFGRADPVRVLLAHSASVNPHDGLPPRRWRGLAKVGAMAHKPAPIITQ
jgi:hypothetical protein